MTGEGRCRPGLRDTMFKRLRDAAPAIRALLERTSTAYNPRYALLKNLPGRPFSPPFIEASEEPPKLV